MKIEVCKFGTADKASEINLSKGIFDIEVSNDVILEVIRWQRAKRRAGTADVKNRSEIRCSRKKIYRQKGTGNARHGAKSAPIFVGGGVAFGPTPRSFEFKLNKKFRVKALKGALSMKVKAKTLKLVDKIDIPDISTKSVKQKLKQYYSSDKQKLLIVDVAVGDKFSVSCHNLPNCKVLSANALNVYDLMKYDVVIMSVDAVKNVEERFNV